MPFMLLRTTAPGALAALALATVTACTGSLDSPLGPSAQSEPGKAASRIFVMYENTAGRFPLAAMVGAVVDQHIRAFHVTIFVARHAGDDVGAREMLLGPADLLRRCPIAERKAGEDDRIEMHDRLEEGPRIGHQRQSRVEIACSCYPPPEFAAAMALLERSW